MPSVDDIWSDDEYSEYEKTLQLQTQSGLLRVASRSASDDECSSCEIVDPSLPSRESVLYGRSIIVLKNGVRKEIPVDQLPQANPKIINE